MAYLSKLAVFSAIASSAFASPVNNGKWSVQQTPVGNYTKNGPRALAAAYSKYKAAIPADVVAAAAASTTGSATATPESDDEAYLIPVSVGGQTLNLDLDTGSSDLYVAVPKLIDFFR